MSQLGRGNASGGGQPPSIQTYRCSWCGLIIDTPESYQLLTRTKVSLHSDCLDAIWRVAWQFKELMNAFEAEKKLRRE